MISNNRAKAGLSSLIGAFLMAAAFTGSAQDAMFVDSTGNVGVGTNSPTVPFHLVRSDGTAEVFVDETSGTNALRRLFTLRNNGSIRFTMANISGNNWVFSNGNAGFSISRAGTAEEMLVRNNGDLEIRGTLTEGSSRSIKNNIVAVDHDTILAKLGQLPISEWNYTGDAQDRHVGPMAEDFYNAFGLGPGTKSIAPKDLAGIALAAAKALKQENERLRQTLSATESEIQALKARLETLEQTYRSER